MRITTRSAVLYAALGTISFLLTTAGLAIVERLPSPYGFSRHSVYASNERMCSPAQEDSDQIYFVSCGGID